VNEAERETKRERQTERDGQQKGASSCVEILKTASHRRFPWTFLALISDFSGLCRRVNCPFYFKVGACRHGDRCSRQHNKPLFSQTVLLAHMYQAPPSSVTNGPTSLATASDDKESQEHFDDFYEEIFEELEKFGKIDEINVCANREQPVKASTLFTPLTCAWNQPSAD
jgi:hypothetical protein